MWTSAIVQYVINAIVCRIRTATADVKFVESFTSMCRGVVLLRAINVVILPHRIGSVCVGTAASVTANYGDAEPPPHRSSIGCLPTYNRICLTPVQIARNVDRSCIRTVTADVDCAAAFILMTRPVGIAITTLMLRMYPHLEQSARSVALNRTHTVTVGVSVAVLCITRLAPVAVHRRLWKEVRVCGELQ